MPAEPHTFYTSMLKERRRADRADQRADQAKDDAAAFKRRWAEERVRAESAEAEVRALRGVVRRLLDGWEYLPAVDEWPASWSHCDPDKLDDEPATAAEVEALRTATADPTPQTETEQ